MRDKWNGRGKDGDWARDERERGKDGLKHQRCIYMTLSKGVLMIVL